MATSERSRKAEEDVHLLASRLASRLRCLREDATDPVLPCLEGLGVDLPVVTSSCRVVAETIASSINIYRDLIYSPFVHPHCIKTRQRRTLRP